MSARSRLALGAALASVALGCALEPPEARPDAELTVAPGEVREIDATTTVQFRRGADRLSFDSGTGPLLLRDPELEAPPWIAVELLESEAMPARAEAGAAWRLRLRMRIGALRPAVDGIQRVRVRFPHGLEVAHMNRCDTPSEVPSLSVAVTVPPAGFFASLWSTLWARIRWGGKLGAFAGLVSVFMLAAVLEWAARRYDLIVLHPLGALAMLVALLFACRLIFIWP